MEYIPGFEAREEFIENQIELLAAREGMDPDSIFIDLAAYAPHEGNPEANPEYLKEMAEKLGISVEEMHQYASRLADAQ